MPVVSQLVDRALRLIGVVDAPDVDSEATTATVIITSALKALGLFEAVEVPPAEDLADGLTALNRMQAHWPAPVAFATLAESHTLEIPLVRAMVLNLALEVAPAYGAAPSQTLVALAQQAYQDVRRRALRTGAVDVLADLLNSWDAEAHGLHATVSTLETVLTLPPAYAQAITYNLAVALAPLYATSPSPDVLKEAQRTLAIVRRLSVDTPERTCDVGVGGFPQVRYDIYSGA